MPSLQRALSVRNLPGGLGYTAGKFYAASLPSGIVPATVNLTANFLYYVPFLCRSTFTADRIAIQNTAAVADSIRMGIYADDGGGHPGTRLVDGGTIVLSGAAADNLATISQQLVGGTLYWLAIVTNATCAVQGFSGSGVNIGDWADFGIHMSYTSGANVVFPTATFAFAALPTPATAVDTKTSTAPFIRLRAS